MILSINTVINIQRLDLQLRVESQWKQKTFVSYYVINDTIIPMNAAVNDKLKGTYIKIR